MTEGTNEQNQDSKKENPKKKKQSFLTKFVLILSLIFFGYFGIKYWQIKHEQKLAAQAQAEKFDNVESEIFDISDEYKDQPHDDSSGHDLSDVTANELKEKGAEFIYQTLLKNQVQINDLREQIQNLKTEVTRYKNQERIGKIIFTYVDLRQKIFAGEPHEEVLKSLEMLAVFDKNLQEKIAKLKPLLANFSTQVTLSKNFDGLIPELIANKNNNPNPTLLDKIRHNVSRLIVIRKIDGKDLGDIDSAIAKTEKFLRQENYQEALNSLLSLDQNYHQILAEFLNELSVSVEVQKLDQEILNYLKSLS